MAPFISPASTHRFSVSSTRAPSHTKISFWIPLKSSASSPSGCSRPSGVSWNACRRAMGFPVLADTFSNFN
eukprot:6811806-Pyramimonas_sp.AAC.1